MSRARFDGIVSHLRETLTGVAHGTEGGGNAWNCRAPASGATESEPSLDVLRLLSGR